MASTVTTTLLFTDLVGSTDLGVVLGDVAADDLRRTYFSLLEHAAAATNGEIVKNLGDGLMVAYRSAADALAGAVAMQQAIEHHNRRPGAVWIDMRVGLSGGDATPEAGDYFGTPVTEAARLCAVASAGEILASELVRAMAGSRSDFRCVERGSYELKGLAEPVAVVEVRWEPTRPDAIALPAPVDHTDAFVFVGRDREMQELAVAWKTAATGARSVVLLAGEPGIGKTRLVAEWARSVHAQGATVLYGRCDEDLGVAYQPFAEALRHYVEVGPLEALVEHVERVGGDLARLVPELTRRVPDSPPPLDGDPDADRYGLFEAVVDVLAAASDRAPVLLILDDLHWAPKATLLLLRHLVRASEPMGLCVVGTYRDSDLARGHPLVDVLADLRREWGVARVALGGLEDVDIATLLENMAGHGLGDDGAALVHALYRETDGNPFFVGELLRHLAESGAVFEQDGRWTYAGDVADLGIPASVREVIGRRVARLPEATQRAVLAASVIGRVFDLTVLSRVSDTPQDESLAALEVAVAAGLVGETAGAPGCFNFAHALVRRTLHDELGAARRMRLHRRVAEALEGRYGAEPGEHVAELAHHWAQAMPAVPVELPDVTRTVHWNERAARHALSALAYEEAMSYYQDALQVLELHDPSGAGAGELLLGLGDAAHRAGEVARAREALLRAGAHGRGLGDAQLTARAALGLSDSQSLFWWAPGTAGMVGVVDEETVAVVEEALAALPPMDSVLRAQLLGRLAFALYWSPSHDRRRALSGEALDMAERLGDEAVIAETLEAQRFVLWGPDNVDDRLELGVRIQDLAERVGDRRRLAGAMLWQTVDLLEVGDLQAADAAADAFRRLGAELREPAFQWVTIVLRGLRVLMQGRFTEAEQLAAEALTAGQRIDPTSAMTNYGAQMLSCWREQGRTAELEAVWDALRPAAAMPAAQAGLALISCELGRIDEGGTVLERLATNDFRDFPRDNSWLPGMAMLALVCANLGDARRADTIYRLLDRYSTRHVVAGFASYLGPVAHYLGLLAATMGSCDKAAEHFEHALWASERTGAHPHLAHTQFEYARTLLSRGELPRGRTLLAEALETARELDMQPLAEKAQSLEQSTS